ncbi:MAG: glycosyltransferase family 2 protein, partial [Prevotella sp.]|nr:glycosyltransferase family 2 protein [Prevotella sp.]
MRTAVVILNWNGEAMLRRFLPSVVKYSAGKETEIIVADNASSDGSLHLLETAFPEVRVIRLSENYGFAEGYNRALAQIDADYFVLLNSDVEVSEGWLVPLADFLDRHPDTAAVQPKILKYNLLPDGSGSRTNSFEYAGAAGGYLDRYGYPYCRGRVLGVVEEDNGQYDEPIETDWASGACLMVRAEDYKQAGGMDARFFAHHEEIDLCWRLRIAGKHIRCVPASRVWHVGGGTLPQGNPRKTYLNYRNNLTMIYKNMPSERLSNVLRMRRLLDNTAALRAFLTGNISEAKAIRKARKDFNNRKRQYKHEREMIQQHRLLPPSDDTRHISI